MKRRHLLGWLAGLPLFKSLAIQADQTSADQEDSHSKAPQSSDTPTVKSEPAVQVGRLGKPRIAVVGAGALGGWAALQLQQQGAQVTLLDAWDPGHTRSSSGGETRVIRHAYSALHHVRLAARALQLWRQASKAWQLPLLHQSGVLFMAGQQGATFLHNVAANLQQVGIEYQLLSQEALQRRYPQIAVGDIELALLEPQSGYLLARRACAAVVEALRREGGVFRHALARPGHISAGQLQSLELDGQGSLQFDHYVFACGPWLGKLFPELLQKHLQITRQEVLYFGTPAGDRLHDESGLPVWADFGERIWYGIPGSDRRGFKIADDTRGPVFDPEHDDRRLSDKGLDAARAYLQHRFPGMQGAALIDARVCQYSNTPDGDFIVDRHPQAGNIWLLGGGCGHAFKHAPALGELLATTIMAEQALPLDYRLSRFDGGLTQTA